MIWLYMTLVQYSCTFMYFGFNSRAFLRHIGLFRETPVGALTVYVLGLYT
jgi:hypothetical protein